MIEECRVNWQPTGEWQQKRFISVAADVNDRKKTTSDLTIITISQDEERSIRLTNIDEQRTSVSSCYFSWFFFSARGRRATEQRSSSLLSRAPNDEPRWRATHFQFCLSSFLAAKCVFYDVALAAFSLFSLRRTAAAWPTAKTRDGRSMAPNFQILLFK